MSDKVGEAVWKPKLLFVSPSLALDLHLFFTLFLETPLRSSPEYDLNIQSLWVIKKTLKCALCIPQVPQPHSFSSSLPSYLSLHPWNIAKYPGDPLQKYLWTPTPVTPALPPSGDNGHHVVLQLCLRWQPFAAHPLNSARTDFSHEGTDKNSPLAHPLIFVKLMCI